MSKDKKELKVKTPAEVGTELKTELAKKQEDNKEGLRVDPSVVNEEAVKAEKAKQESIKSKKAVDKEVAKETASLSSPLQVDNKKVQGVEVNESEALVDAVKKDAEARKKNFKVCPITGVLVVG